jgi:two-component system, NarL family, nitrate/nitrite response regulator NarL
MDPNRDATGHASVSILIVADVRLYRESLALMLSSRGFVPMVSTAKRLDGLTKAREHRPAVAIVDIGSRGALEFISALRQEPVRPKILGLAVDEETSDVIECAEAGADGFVTADATIEELERAIHHVGHEELLCSPRIAATLFHRLANGGMRAGNGEAQDGLTNRERQIWNFIGQGLSNKEIAAALNISIPTVKNHVHHLLGKLHVSTRRQAASRIQFASRRL